MFTKFAENTMLAHFLLIISINVFSLKSYFADANIELKLKCIVYKASSIAGCVTAEIFHTNKVDI